MADAEQVEMHLVLGEVFERAKRGFGGDSKITEGAGLSNGPTEMERAVPLQCHLSRALTGLRSIEAEVGKLESFPARVQGDDALTPGRTGLFEEKGHGVCLGLSWNRDLHPSHVFPEQTMGNATPDRL